MNAHIKAKRPRIYFTGVGGQGTLTATKLLAQAATDCGIEAVGGEVHGMAQRGGVVESVLLLGGWRAPRLDFGEADIILGFEPLETLRALPYLHKGGLVFSSTDPLPPLSVNLGEKKYPPLDFIEEEVAKAASQCWFLPCRELGQKAGAIQSGNTILLAALCLSGALPFGLPVLENAINRHLPEKIRQVNINAIKIGAEFFMALKG